MTMRLRQRASGHTWWLIGLLLTYLALGIYYGLRIPPFESPDELHHMGYVVHLAREGRLPVQNPGEQTLYEQEGSQPPLYYVLAAALVRGLDLSDFEQVTEPNPYARIGLPSAMDNQNLVMHPPGQDRWSGSLLALQIVRALSLIMGAGTVLSTYMLTRLLLPQRPGLALAVAATNAFTPMFLYISASANNDSLIALTASLALATLAYTATRGVSVPRLLALGGLCGLALLAKLSGIALLGLVLLALLVIAASQVAGVDSTCTPGQLRRLWRQADIRGVARRWAPWAALVSGLAVAIAGWWYLRNLRLSGDLTGINTMLAIFGTRSSGPPSLAALLGEVRGFVMSYWGVFGIFNVLMRPQAVYPVLLAVTGMALASAGLVLWRAWRRQSALPWALLCLLGLWVVGLLVSLLRWTSMTYASQGRLIFPGISVLSLALVMGLSTWFRGRARAVAEAALPVLLLGISVLQPQHTIARAYAAPTPLTAEDIPVTAQAVHASFGPVELVAYDLDRVSLAPGERAVLTLYWWTHERVDDDLTLYVHVFGREGAKIAQRDSFHGGGTYPTSYWEPGQVIRDQYAVDIDVGAQGPTAAEIVVGLYHRDDMEPIVAADPAGNPVGKLTIARLKVTGETVPATPQWPTDASLGDVVRLVGYDADWARWDGESELSIILHWEVLGSLDRDYTVFLHLVDQHGAMLGQGDGPPCLGEYPTRFWDAGETLADPHVITMHQAATVNEVRVLVGLYDPISGERVPATDASGTPIGAPIGDHITITPPADGR